MRSLASALLVLGLGLSGLVSAEPLGFDPAAAVAPPSLNANNLALRHLFLRQGGSIPQVPGQCKSTCDPVNSKLVNGCPASDCCNTNFIRSYFNCTICLGTALNVSDYSEPQRNIDDFDANCAAKGFPNLPKGAALTLPGQNPKRPLPSAASSLATPQQQSTVTNIPQSTVGPSGSAVGGGGASLTPILPLTQTTVSAGSANTGLPSVNPSPAAPSAQAQPNRAGSRLSGFEVEKLGLVGMLALAEAIVM